MGLFANQKTLDRLEDRLRALEVKADSMERGARSLNLEYTELYDKVSHQMSRMAKRYSRAEKETELDPEEVQNDLPFPDADPVSRSILLRRGGVSLK
jgi:hypothetical protein